jgi:hypothetical protein
LLTLNYTIKILGINEHSANHANSFSEASNGSSPQNVGRKPDKDRISLRLTIKIQ